MGRLVSLKGFLPSPGHQVTGEAQAWGHLAQRRVGATLSEDEDMKPACVRSGESPAPLPAKLPEHLHGGLSHTGS